MAWQYFNFQFLAILARLETLLKSQWTHWIFHGSLAQSSKRKGLRITLFSTAQSAWIELDEGGKKCFVFHMLSG